MYMLTKCNMSETDSLVENYEEDSEVDKTTDVVAQILSDYIETHMVKFPMSSSQTLNQTSLQINQFLQHTNSSVVQKLSQNTSNFLKKFDWLKLINAWLKTNWNQLVKDIQNHKPSDYFQEIDNLVFQANEGFKLMLNSIKEVLESTPLKEVELPLSNQYYHSLLSSSRNLKERTKKLKLQAKFCPGVEPPKLKQVTREVHKTETRPYTEWKPFLREEVFEVVPSKTCVGVLGLCPFFTSCEVQKIKYLAPYGWEVNTAQASVIEGNFKEANVSSVRYRNNAAVAEVEVHYPSLSKELIQCKVQLEGVISRRRTQDVDVVHQETVWVVVDQYGEHQLPGGFLESCDFE